MTFFVDLYNQKGYKTGNRITLYPMHGIISAYNGKRKYNLNGGITCTRMTGAQSKVTGS